MAGVSAWAASRIRTGVDIKSSIVDHLSSMQDVALSPTPIPLSHRIAAHVRALRNGQGMSLDVLSERCGVSRSMISLIERGESSPTAAVLEKIASGLGVPLAAFFDEPASSASPVSKRNDRTIWRDPESGYERRNISPANFASAIRIVEVSLPPGTRVAYERAAGQSHIHQQIWIQQGEIELTVGLTTHRLAEDDCLAMKLGESIVFANRTRNPARYIVVIASERLSVSCGEVPSESKAGSKPVGRLSRRANRSRGLKQLRSERQ